MEIKGGKEKTLLTLEKMKKIDCHQYANIAIIILADNVKGC